MIKVFHMLVVQLQIVGHESKFKVTGGKNKMGTACWSALRLT